MSEEIEKDMQDMQGSVTDQDIKYRQGRSKKQVENNEKIMFIALIGLGIVLLGIIIYGLSYSWVIGIK